MRTHDTADVAEIFISDHTDTRKRIAALKARLEAISAALNMAALHVECTIKGIETPAMQQAFSRLPSPDDLYLACADYRNEVRRSLELAETLAVLGK